MPIAGGFARGVWMAVGMIAASSFVATPGLGQQAPIADRACSTGSDTDPRPRVVIGRFVLAGEYDANLARNLESAFAGNLVAGFLGRGETAIFGFDQVRRYKDLNDQVSAAFVSGPPRDSKPLAALLKSHNCTHLLAGRISRDADTFGVTVFQLDAGSGEFQRSTPVFGDVQTIMRAGDHFATEFGQSLRQKQVASDQIRAIEPGCITVVPTLPVAAPEVERLVASMRQMLGQALANEKRYLVKTPADKPICPATENASGDVTMVLAAELRRNRERDAIEMRPIVRVPETVAGKRVSITLPATIRPVAQILSLPADYTSALRSFLFVATKPDGSLPEEIFGAPPTLEDLWKFEPELKRAVAIDHPERIALAAYRILATTPDNPAPLYMLGFILQAKRQPQQALDYLQRARQRPRDDWTPYSRGNLSETLGIALHDLRRPADGVQYLQEAKAEFEAAGKKEDAARASRNLARALFAAGNREKAFDEVRSQPNLEADAISLRVVGQFSLLSDQYNDAIVWLRKALAVNPNDSPAQMYLADAYEAVGKDEFAAGRPRQALENYDLATRVRTSSRTYYLAALAAYELGQYEDAAARFEKALAGTGSNKLSVADAEGSWLTVLESFLLVGKLDELEKRYDAVIAGLADRPSARLLATYLRFAARVIGDTTKTAAELEKDPAYQGIMNADPSVSAKNLSGWDNSNIDKHIRQATLAPDKRALLDAATQRVWRDTPKLQ